MHLVKTIKNTTFYEYLKCSYFCLKYDVRLFSGSRVGKNTFFEGGNVVHNNSCVTGSYLGYGTYISNNSIVKNAKIGKYCAIGDNVRTSLGLHPSSDFVSIHPAFFSLNEAAKFTFVKSQLFEEHKYIDKDKKYVVEIGNDVWVGNNVIILDGVKVGNGAIIAAGSIVTKDVDNYAIVAGVPARIIKHRFSKSEIEFLQKFKWWEKEISWLKNNAHFFTNITQFYNRFFLDNQEDY